jgi:Zn-dependent protease
VLLFLALGNLLLGLFNLLPLPPLDGAGVLQGLWPNHLGRFYQTLQTTPMAQILGLLVAWKVFGLVSGPALLTTYRLIYG